MMPSKVTDLLPRAISNWIAGRRQTNTNGSVPAADTPEPTPEPTPERTLTSPPAKRARYEPSASITNYYVQPEITTIRRSDDQAGPSGYRPETVAVSPSREPAGRELASREQAGRARWPDVTRSGGTRTVTRVNLFRGNETKEEASEKNKATPSTPTASKRPHSSVTGSPFYPGKTIYGGAGASSMYLYEPNIQRRATAVVAEPLYNVDNSISSTTRRLMNLLEQCATPLSERRVVQTRAPAGLDSTRNASLIGQSIAPSFASSYKTQELRVSHLPTLLRLKQGARLRESTRAARHMAASSPNALAPYPTPLAAPAAGSAEMTTSTPWSKQTNKMKSQVGRNPARKGAQSAVETEILPPLNLPSGILNIDATNLPNISFSTNSDSIILKKTAVVEIPEDKPAQFKFSKPTEVIESQILIPTTKSKFTFSKPENISQKSMITNGPRSLAESKPVDFNFSTKPTVVENGEIPAKDWKCEDCWVFNKSERQKCIACGGSKSLAKPTAAILKDWQCKDCWVFNKDAVKNCIACSGSKPKTGDKTSEKNVKTVTPIVKDWQCKDCWVYNNASVQKCIACGGTKVDTTTKKTIDESPKDWRCQDCWVMNKDEILKCAACGGSKPSPKPAVDESEKWQCSDCWVFNKNDAKSCIACAGLNPKKSTTKSPSSQLQNSVGVFPKDKKFSDLVKNQTDKWECTTCLARNSNSVAKCACCETPKPGAKINEESAKFNFPATPTSFKFGIPAASALETEKILKTSEEDKSTKGILNVDSSKSSSTKTVTFTFGIPKPAAETGKSVEKEETKDVPKFSFGMPLPASTASITNKPTNLEGKSEVDSANTTNGKDAALSSSTLPSMNTSLGFNFTAVTSPLSKSVNEKATNETTVTNSSATLFGIPSSDSTTQVSSAMFTLPTNSSKPGTSSTLFGIPTKTTAAAEVTSSPFGIPSNIATTTASPPMLGMPSSMAKTTEASSTLFRIPSNPAKTEALPVVFGMPTNSATTTEVPVSLFGVPKTTESGGLFGKTPEQSSSMFKIPSTMPKTEGSSTLFGMPSNTNKTTKAPSTLFVMSKTTEDSSTLFGMPSNTAKPSETSTTLFGIPSTVATSTEATPTLFGMAPNAAKTSEANTALFGMPTKTSEASSVLFGIPSTNAKPSDTPSLFGVPSNASKTEIGLSGTSQAPLFPSSGAFTLPKVDNSSTQMPAPLFSFGTATQEPAKPAASSRFNFTFGGTSAEPAPPSFNSTFGGPTSQQPANPTAGIPSFSMPSSNPFGTQPQTSLFGSNAQTDPNKTAIVPNKAPFTFGSPSNTMFGQPQPQTNTGSSNTMFGQQGSTMFGANQPASKPEFAAPSLFGGQPARNPAPMGMFGASSMGGNANFGSAPSANPPTAMGQAPAAMGQAPAFNFGATSSTPMFGFGQQSASPQPGIYSFGGAPSTGVQFSLGTSAGTPQAAAPGARRVRKAVRRTQR